ncbi:hypothetical protein JTB14_022127 [Gonioctena quinquepunctata]|nr:hypothetical protein JTB14_022127 [Gonioctena quinquepunctata]
MAKAKIAQREEARLAAEQRAEDDENVVPGPPDGGYGWVIVAACFVCNMAVDGISYSFGICLSDLVDYYGESKGTTAWVGSILSGATMCVGPIVGAVVNKFGCRTSCILGSIVGAAAFALSTFSPSVTVLMFVYGLIGGIGMGTIYLPAVVCVGYYFESKRSLATGLTVCGSGFGTFAFAPLATYLVGKFGWKGTNLCFASILLSCSLCGALMKPLEIQEVVTTDEVTGSVSKKSSRAIPRSATSEEPIASNAVYNSNLSVSVRRGSVLQPLARKDIFYSGSVTNLKEFQSQRTLNSYRQSVHSISRSKSKSSCLPGNLGDTLGELLDVSLLKDPVFFVLLISNIFSMGALYIPFVYIVECAIADGIDANSAAFLVSIIGIVNTVFRVLMAIAVGLLPFCHTYVAYLISATGFAIGISGYIALTPIILVDLMDLDKLTNAFGLIMMFRGFAALIGSPIGGALYDATKSYDYAFFFAGGLFAVGAAISFAAPLFKRKKTVVMDEALTPMNSVK